MKIKKYIASVLLVGTLVTLVGCASPRKGPAFGQSQEFRRQLAQSIPVKDYGYTIKDLMFTDDYRSALVIFTHPDSNLRGSSDIGKKRPDWEFTLESNGFRRYKGMEMQPFYTPGTGNTPPVNIVVTLPAQ